MSPEGKPRPWLATPALEGSSDLSPDGRLLAFVSNLSGRSEVYVQPLDQKTTAVAVSTAGGNLPVWSPGSDRVFFRQGNLIMAAAIHTQVALDAEPPEVVVDGGWPLSSGEFAALPDGRLLMVKSEPEAVPTHKAKVPPK